MFLLEGEIVLVFIPNRKRFETQCIIISSALYCINLVLVFHHLYEPSEIPDRLLLLNQNKLSYATEMFAAH